MDAPDTKSLPENAYLPLAPGQTYQPLVPATVNQEEATTRSVGWGLFLCIVFTVASAYSGLKVGQVMEFTPAMNRDKQVPVWVSIPITFQVR